MVFYINICCSGNTFCRAKEVERRFLYFSFYRSYDCRNRLNDSAYSNYSIYVLFKNMFFKKVDLASVPATKVLLFDNFSYEKVY